MKKLLILLAALFFLSGCSSALNNAENYYKQGNYLQSVETIADFLDNQNKDFSNPDAQKMFVIIDNVVKSYEQQINTAAFRDYDSRISAYDGLLFMRKRLDNRPYDSYIRFFTAKYSINQLNQTLAKLYYDKGTAISGVDKYSYKAKAEAFEKGMTHFSYKDTERLFSVNDKKYRTMFAEDYFNSAQNYVKNKRYQDAAEQFTNAVDIYAKYGDYKNSKALAARYDQMYRKAETDRLYNEATSLSQSAKSHADYRQAAKLFYNSYLVYQHYGQSNNAKALYEKYAEAGQIKLYIDADSHFVRLIKDKLKAEHITFVNTASAANVTMRIHQDFSFYQDKDRLTEKSLSERIKERTEQRKAADGSMENHDVYKTYDFISHTVESRNRARLKLELVTTGDLFYKATYSVEKSSELLVVNYTGNVPAGYKNHSKGQLLSERKMRDKLLDDVWVDLVRDINKIAKELETA